jgi:capsule polysaccharide export protein KpsE/RkpR
MSTVAAAATEQASKRIELTNPADSSKGDTKKTIRDLRRSRARGLLGRFMAVVLLPTLLSAIYFALVASPQFESTALFTVQSSDSRQGLSLDTFLGAVPGVGSSRDTLAARDFILSRDMLAELDAQNGLVEHYRRSDVDWWARLSGDASFEDAFEYYQDNIRIEHDSNSDVLTLRVRAFGSETAHAFSKTILDHTERVINRLSKTTIPPRRSTPGTPAPAPPGTRLPTPSASPRSETRAGQ